MEDIYKCPICTEQYESQCKCSHNVIHNMDSLSRGHGFICPNGHKWTRETGTNKIIFLESKKMNIVDYILKEAQIPIENLFNGHDNQRYSFIWRDVTKYNSVEKKREIVDRLEKLRLKSGAGLPIKKLNPQMFVATQETVDADKIKKMAGDYNNITALPFVVKLNGVYYALDGHHRTSVALIAQKDYVNCRFLDLDDGNFA